MEKPELDWALRYGFFECIQIIIDLSVFLVSKLNFGSPEYYLESIELLHNNNILDDELFSSLTKIVGLRNKLVHDYDEIKIDQLILYLDEISDFKAFVVSVRKYLD